ncbi:MAG: sulfotransferase, partial [Pseudomonadota bacterium]|nr:sulfotransferase [Pseudomonadota bacterium]
MLNKQELFTQSMKAAERSAFVDQGFEPVLDRLLIALNTEASLNEVGAGFHSARLQDLLTNRLRMEAWFEKHPEILEETIERPIVVVGLPRTGTTMLHRTIATDSSLLAPIWYEVRQPVPLANDFELGDERIGISEAEVAAMLEAAPELAAIHPMDARAP